MTDAVDELAGELEVARGSLDMASPQRFAQPRMTARAWALAGLCVGPGVGIVVGTRGSTARGGLRRGAVRSARGAPSHRNRGADARSASTRDEPDHPGMIAGDLTRPDPSGSLSGARTRSVSADVRQRPRHR